MRFLRGRARDNEEGIADEPSEVVAEGSASPDASSDAALTSQLREGLAAAEIDELEREVAHGRWDELAAVALHDDGSSYLPWSVQCLAAVIDLPATRLASWSRFVNEVSAPHAYLWSDELYGEVPDGSVVAGGYSYESRLLFAALDTAGVTYRRTADEMMAKYGFTSDQVSVVRDELLGAGIATWGVPSVREAIERFTLADLEPAMNGLEIKKSWTKARKVDTILEAIGESGAREFVLAARPDAFDEVFTIRFESSVDDGFHRSWAALAGHFIGSCATRDRTWTDLRRTRSVDPSAHIAVDVIPAGDDCVRCQQAGSSIVAEDRTTWPPFHLGCRCIVGMTY